MTWCGVIVGNKSFNRGPGLPGVMMALVSDSPAHGRSLTRVWTARPNKRRITDNKVAQATSDCSGLQSPIKSVTSTVRWHCLSQGNWQSICQDTTGNGVKWAFCGSCFCFSQLGFSFWRANRFCFSDLRMELSCKCVRFNLTRFPRFT